MPTTTDPSAQVVDDLPIFREGPTDLASYDAFQADPVGFHLRAYRALGPIYRTWFRNKLWVVLAGLEANEFVWRNSRIWSYGVANATLRDELGPDHLTGLDGEDHRLKRSVLKAAFDQAPSFRYLPQFSALFAATLAEIAGQPVDLVGFWSYAITKANSRTVAQADIPDQTLRNMARFENQMLRGAFLDDGRTSFIVQENYRRVKADTFLWLNQILDERLAHPGAHDDNAELAFRARREEQGAAARRDQFLNDLYLILVAGTDNTTALINWALFYTFRNPAWLARLRAELDAWDGRDPMAIAQMPCLKATVMETQRLRPGSPFVLSKHAGEGFSFNGYEIPGGTDVVHAYVLGQFLEELYPDPFAFRPERFLEGGKFAPKSFGFFGGGTHVCVGRNLTMMQAPLAVAHAVRGYDLELEAEPQFELKVGSAGRRLDEQIMGRLNPR